MSSANPGVLPAQADALFVINQDASLQAIADKVRDAGANSVIVVTTHAFFPEEADRLQTLCGLVRLWWLPMSSLLSDAQMEGCDDDAVAALAPNGGRVDAAQFMQLSRRLRNMRAAETLARHSAWSACFAADGLGVVMSAWDRAQPLPQVERAQGQISGSRLATHLAHARWATRVERIEGEDATYLFFGGTNRLRFADDVKRTVFQIPLSRAILRGRGPGSTRRYLTGAAASVSAKRPVRIATTVHHFHPAMLDAFPELLVFADGLHTPNYPVSYGASFRGARIVAREESDTIWFKKCGCVVEPPASILAPEKPYQNPSRPRPIRNICLMLNHAGDWTALIDRSDTDLVVSAFVAAAAVAPEFAFRVRAHPTMATSYHEGEGSRDRLRDWVRSRDLPNLEFSEGTLDEDFAWTDLCVTEYSNVLIDCMKAGKGALALNPTGRRNLVAHLEPYGLQEVHDAAELVAFIRATALPEESVTTAIRSA